MIMHATQNCFINAHPRIRPCSEYFSMLSLDKFLRQLKNAFLSFREYNNDCEMSVPLLKNV